MFWGAGVIVGLFAHWQSSLGLGEESEGFYPASAGLEVASARMHQTWPSVGSQQGPAPATSKDGVRAPMPQPTPLPQALQSWEGRRAAQPPFTAYLKAETNHPRHTQEIT